jgi:hypothetical protein
VGRADARPVRREPPRALSHCILFDRILFDRVLFDCVLSDRILFDCVLFDRVRLNTSPLVELRT